MADQIPASYPRRRRRRGIRWHLFQVLLVAIVPIGLLAATLLYLHWRVQEHERSQIESVRLLAVAVDNALDSSVERLANLLVNAATYTSAGGRIRVRIAREDTIAVIEVSDDGQGIQPENLPRVFDLFFQGESTSERSASGLGIGLTLVQRLAALHGGDVKASSGGSRAGRDVHGASAGHGGAAADDRRRRAGGRHDRAEPARSPRYLGLIANRPDRLPS